MLIQLTPANWSIKRGKFPFTEVRDRRMLLYLHSTPSGLFLCGASVWLIANVRGDGDYLLQVE